MWTRAYFSKNIDINIYMIFVVMSIHLELISLSHSAIFLFHFILKSFWIGYNQQQKV
jgi:hypothetical protein